MFHFLRKLVILNECEGSQERTELRYLTLAPSGVDRWFAMLSMTNYFWVNTYIIANVKGQN